MHNHGARNILPHQGEARTMKRLQLAAIAVVAITLSACTTTQQVADSAFSPPRGDYRVIVMQPDISVGVLTAGSGFEHREDWTNQARLNVTNALAAPQSKRGGEMTI